MRERGGRRSVTRMNKTKREIERFYTGAFLIKGALIKNDNKATLKLPSHLWGTLLSTSNENLFSLIVRGHSNRGSVVYASVVYCDVKSQMYDCLRFK